MHVSTRVLAGLPSLRGRRLWQAVRRSLLLCRDRGRFRIVHFSVQGQDIHLIVEADDRQALSRGVQGFKISVARRLNRVCERSGTVFADRYGERVIQDPLQCRHAVGFVLGSPGHTSARHERWAITPQTRLLRELNEWRGEGMWVITPADGAEPDRDGGRSGLRRHGQQLRL